MSNDQNQGCVFSNKHVWPYGSLSPLSVLCVPVLPLALKGPREKIRLGSRTDKLRLVYSLVVRARLQAEDLDKIPSFE